MRYIFIDIGGSNPSLSASKAMKEKRKKFLIPNGYSEKDTDNQVQVAADPGRFAGQFARFMVSSFSINTGSVGAETGQASIENAQLEMDPNMGSVDGSIGSINVKSISGTANR